MKKIFILFTIIFTINSSAVEKKSTDTNKFYFDITHKVKVNINQHFEGEVKNTVKCSLDFLDSNKYNGEIINYIVEDNGGLRKISEKKGKFLRTENTFTPVEKDSTDISLPDFSKINFKKGMIWESSSSEYFDISRWGFKDTIVVPAEIIYKCSDLNSRIITVNAKSYINHIPDLKSIKPLTPVKITGTQEIEYTLDSDKIVKGYIKKYNFTFQVKNNDVYDFYGEEICIVRHINEIKFLDTKKIETAAENKLDKKDMNFKIDDIKITIRLNELYFDTGKSDFKIGNQDKFNQLVQFINSIKEKYTINIEGHTDNTGDPQYNDILSKLRAKTVRDFLLTQISDKKTQISYIGYGDKKPIESNVSEEGRKKNRRVEIIIQPE